MTKLNHVISADVKAQILERVKEGAPIAQIAQEHGISNRTIYGWLSKGVTASPTWIEYHKLKRENQALKELIAETYQVIHNYNTIRIHTKLKMAPRQYLKILTNQSI